MSIFKRKSRNVSSAFVEIEEVKPMKAKQQQYKVVTSTSVMTDIELNTLYEVHNWELIQIVDINSQNFQHIFKKRK